MTWEGWYVLGILLIVTVALVRNWGPADAVLFGASLLAGLAQIISVEQVFSGFVNRGTLTIAALFIVAAAMRTTGALDSVANIVFGRVRSERAGLIRMTLPVASLSAFFNNTPIVAMLMPVVISWCRRNNIQPSRLLMPLSFMAILGGTCTLIGTSTNLAIDGLMLEALGNGFDLPDAYREALRPIGLFEMAWVGVPFVIVGTIYLLTIGQKRLASRVDPLGKVGTAPREYMADMQIQKGCRLIGQTVEEAGLRHLPGLFLTEIDRGDEIISPVAPHQKLEEGDVLTFGGVVDTIVDLERIKGLVPVADEAYEQRAFARRGQFLAEAVISARSPLIGKTIRDANFRGTYGAAIIAVHRGAERIRGRLGDIVLRAGDTLLVQSGERFTRIHRDNPDFYLVSSIDEGESVRHDRAIICWMLMGLLIVLMLMPSVEYVYAAFLVAGLMVITRCISPAQARKSLDWETLITIGAAFGLGHALQESGAAEVIAAGLFDAAGSLGPRGQLFIVYAVTSLFAALVSSKAAAVLMFSIALETALAMEVDPRPFIMAVAFASASSFSTPLGYPTNLMVYGTGGYRFTDFIRVGLPLNATLAILAIVAIPIVWPF